MPEPRAPERAPARYQHDLLLHDSADDVTAVAVPFLRDGLTAGEAAVIVAGAATTEMVRDALGADDRLIVLDRDDVYRARPPAALTAFRRLARDRTAAGATSVRVFAEPDFGATPRDWLEWQRYEAVINRALAPFPLWGVCSYDTRLLPAELVDCVLSTHPHRHTTAGRQASADYREPADYLRALPIPVEPLEDTAPLLDVDDVTDFIGLRHAVAAQLATLGGSADLVEDLHLAIDEMSSNAVRHGGPPVRLRLWAAADRVVCTISDRGPGMDDPFAGYGPAHGEDLSRGGMGLWLARQLCDHVDVMEHDGGLTVRLTTALH